ncbi:unnamed protein product, partial [Amoebophrya sp. A120]|eukprot:GSA120T00006233001.1
MGDADALKQRDRFSLEDLVLQTYENFENRMQRQTSETRRNMFGNKTEETGGDQCCDTCCEWIGRPRARIANPQELHTMDMPLSHGSLRSRRLEPHAEACARCDQCWAHCWGKTCCRDIVGNCCFRNCPGQVLDGCVGCASTACNATRTGYRAARSWAGRGPCIRGSGALGCRLCDSAGRAG